MLSIRSSLICSLLGSPLYALYEGFISIVLKRFFILEVVDCDEDLEEEEDISEGEEEEESGEGE